MKHAALQTEQRHPTPKIQDSRGRRVDTTRFKASGKEFRKEKSDRQEKEKVGTWWGQGGIQWVQGTGGASVHWQWKQRNLCFSCLAPAVLPPHPSTGNRLSTFDSFPEVWRLEAALTGFSSSVPGRSFPSCSRLSLYCSTPPALSLCPSGVDASLFPGRSTSPCAACKDLSLGTSSPSCHSTPSLFHHFPISHFSSSHLPSITLHS